MSFPLPPDETQRLESLRRLNILDSAAEREFNDLTRLAAQICRVPISLVRLIDADRQWFKSKLGLEASETPRDIAFCAHALVADEIFVVPDALEDERFADNPLVASEPHIRFYAGAPLVADDGEALGTLCVIDTKPRELNPEQKESLKALARQATTLLNLHRQTEALARANRELETSEDQYRFLAESLPQLVWTAYPDGKLDYVNRRAIEYYGKNEENELLGMRWLETLHPEDLAQTFEHWTRAVKTGELYETVFRLRRFDGEYRWHLTQAAAMRDSKGKVVKWFGTSTDVHERKLAAEALNKSEEYRNLFRLANDAILIFDPADETVLDANERACEIYGFAREEFLGKSIKDISRETARGEEPLQELLRKGTCREFETVQLRADGTPIHFLISASVIEFQGKPAVLSINRDITERKQAENNLRRSQSNLAAAQRITHLGSWEVDLFDLKRLENNKVRWSDEVYRIFGYKPEETDISINTYFNLIHPAERKFVRRAFLEAVSYRKELNIQYRIVLPNGGERVQHGQGEVLYDELTNQPLKFIGTVQDITERRQAEDKLALLASIVESSNDAIISKTLDGGIVSWNRGAEQLYGYAQEEVIGENIRLLVPPGHENEEPEIDEKIERGESVQHYETVRMKKDGSLVDLSLTVSPIKNAAGEVVGASRIARDISNRKRVEERLRDSEEWLKASFAASRDGIVVEDDGKLVYVNHSYARLLKYDQPEELIGRHIADILPPDEAKRLSEFGTRRLRGESVPSIYRFNGLCKDESLIEVEGSVSSYVIGGKKYIMTAIRDIADRKRAEAELRASEYKLRTLVASMSEGLAQVNNDEEIEFVNDRFCEMTGYCPEDLLGKITLDVLFDEEGKKFVLEANRQRRKGFVGQYELRLRKKTGEFLYVIVGGAPIVNAEGEIVGSMGIFTDITTRKRAEEQLLHDAFHDDLTGLANRALFMDHLRMTIERGKSRHSNPYAVLFLDFDRFKVVNDSLGHAEGDRLLKHIARRIESATRSGDLTARLGGDEFVVLLNELVGDDDAVEIAERIQENLKKPFDLSGNEIYISASIGIAPSAAGHQRAEDMVRDADIAMYRAKAKGRAQYQIFDRAMHEQASKQLSLETEMRRALEREEFLIHYQPIINLATETLVGFEALVRWKHPERGMIPPFEFIPAAEENNLILPLGNWILRESCRQLRHWQTEFPAAERLTVSVNLSTKQFSQPDLAEQIARALDVTGLDPRSLKLEITESHVMENSETAIGIMNNLRALGVELSLDDFGTGYSSLSYLHRLPADYLKIDRSFVMRMTESEENSEIVSTVIKLAQNLKMKVIAEGIETQEQLAHLRRLGCEYGQGYFFSKPLEARNAEMFISEVAESFLHSANTRITNSELVG